MISIDWPHNNYHICPHYILRITLGSSCDTFSDNCTDTNWLILMIFWGSAQSDLRTIGMLQIGPTTCQVHFLKVVPWTKGGRDTAQSLQKGKTLASRPHDHRFHLHVPLQKWRVIRGHFCQQKACVRVSGSVRLPTGQRDSLHSNYGSALFLRSTLEASVQSQTCTEQHEQERGHWQHRQAQHWCHWLLPHCYWI